MFVGRLSWNVDDDGLKQFFVDENVPGVVSARVITENGSGRSKGFGYVDFDSVAHAEAAVKKYDGAEIDGRAVHLDMAASKPRSSSPNDRANSRAKKYGDTPSDPSDTLFVGNLSFEATMDDVRGAFESFGSIEGIRIPTRPGTEDPRGFAYVQFSSVDEAKAALEGMNGENINGRSVRLDYSTPRPRNNNFGGRSGGRGNWGDRGDRGRGNWGDRGDRGRGNGRFGGNRGGRERRPAASGANAVPVHFKGSKKTFD